jgi:hypothetical protein
MRAMYCACWLLLFAGLMGFAGSLLSAAPRGKPEPPDFEAVTVFGRWDGDKNQPWLRADNGVVWRLCFPGRGSQDVALGPFDSTRRIRVTGLAATGGECHYLFVTALTAVD